MAKGCVWKSVLLSMALAVAMSEAETIDGEPLETPISSYEGFINGVRELVKKPEVFKALLPESKARSEELEKFGRRVLEGFKNDPSLREDLESLDWRWYAALDIKKVDKIFRTIDLEDRDVSSLSADEFGRFLESMGEFTPSFLVEIREGGGLIKLAWVQFVFSVARRILEGPVEE